MSVTNPADEYEALVHVLVRVSRRFPSVPEDRLVELIAGEVSRFGRVRLRNYVPVLVEANVVRTLRGTTRSGG
ncbi:three-helix bundle dimerization domain-containing protein [uncultured Microbacterium sp.]|uniref:three-helix bundle dimerization domain-containing protein n=1 Tax=Microbacterium sp. PRF11 TaxID=2962593 RepID=UPI003450069F